jgi:ABC-type multidrug transport system ATPase subunit
MSQVMCAVRALCNRNRTVMCTIHQPSAEAFQLFDKLILVADGRQVTHG